MSVLQKSVWVYVECHRCGQRFHPNRQTVRERFNSKRCPKCGYKHSLYDVERIDLKCEQDDKELYMFHDETNDLIKIGISTNAHTRLEQIKTANPFQISMVAKWNVKNAHAVEKKIHAKLFERSFSGEWFLVDDTSVDRIKDAIDIFVEGYKKLE